MVVSTSSIGSVLPGLRDYTVQLDENGSWTTVGSVTDEYFNRMEELSFPTAIQRLGDQGHPVRRSTPTAPSGASPQLLDPLHRQRKRSPLSRDLLGRGLFPGSGVTGATSLPAGPVPTIFTVVDSASSVNVGSPVSFSVSGLPLSSLANGDTVTYKYGGTSGTPICTATINSTFPPRLPAVSRASA